jgi:hypothetical protein
MVFHPTAAAATHAVGCIPIGRYRRVAAPDATSRSLAEPA